MSFGFGIGDFLAVIDIANKLRKGFVGAPAEFKAISDDIRELSIVLQDAEVYGHQLKPDQFENLQDVVTSCKGLLESTEKTLEKYVELSSAGSSKGKALKRAWKRFKWEPDDVRDIRSQISVKLSALSSFSNQALINNVVQLVRHQESAERQSLLEWISSINHVARQNDLFGRCQEGSRRWLFESPKYQEWLRLKGATLFCPGSPGTGKTFTLSMVAEELRNSNDRETLTAYVYCNYQNRAESVEALLSSLLRVAMEEALVDHEHVSYLCEQARSSKRGLSRHSLSGLLQDLFSGYNRVYLLVDALDELPHDIYQPFCFELLKLQAKLGLNFFLTSRDIPELRRPFQSQENYLCIEVRASDEDIRQFLRDNLFRLPSFVGRSPKLQSEAIEAVTEASAGIFLLAELHIQSLSRRISKGSLRAELSKLATGSSAYDELYEDAMKRIEFQGPEPEQVAKQTLLVLSCARRALSARELVHCLSVEQSSESIDEDMIPEMDDLVSTCNGLVVVDEVSDVVRLVHKSTQEYFERNRSRWFPKSQGQMALLCFQYLRIAKSGDKQASGDTFPFYDYAKTNWSHHALMAENEINEIIGTDISSSEIWSSKRNKEVDIASVSQLAIQQMTREVVDVRSSIVDACYAGHQAWVEQLLLVRNFDVNQGGKRTLRGDEYMDDVLLTIAVAGGDHSMATMLLARGADPNKLSAFGETALFIAVKRNYNDIVSLLLGHNRTDPDAVSAYFGNHDRVIGEAGNTALLLAAQLGRIDSLKLLLNRSNRKVRNTEGKNAMWLAAADGHYDVIKELLTWSDIEVDSPDSALCFSPLSVAIRHRHEQAALALLPRANIGACKSCGRTALYRAAACGLHTLLQELLQQDATLADQGPYTRDGGVLANCCSTPKRYRYDSKVATEEQKEREKALGTPLIAAVYNKDVEAVRILASQANVNHGVCVAAEDKTQGSAPRPASYWHALHQATVSGNCDIVKLLLARDDVEVDVADGSGRTPFLLAAEHGDADILQELVRHGGIAWDRRGRDGKSAADYIIHPHFHNGAYFRVLASVLDLEVNKANSEGSAILHQACSLLPIFEYIYEGFSGYDIEYFKALRVDANAGSLVAEILQVPGVDPNLRDAEGNTPLLLAVKSHQRDAVRALLAHPATDPNARNKAGDCPLRCSARYVPFCQQVLGPAASQAQICLGIAEKNWKSALDEEYLECDDAIFSMLVKDGRSCYDDAIENEVIDGAARAGRMGRMETILGHTGLSCMLDAAFLNQDGFISAALRSNDHDDAVEFLIRRCPPALLQHQDALGRTPLSYAAQRNTVRAAECILDMGDAAINLVDSLGRTALSYAAEMKKNGVLQLLLLADGIEFIGPDYRGKTPLHHAASGENVLGTLALLEKEGIKAREADNEGHSALCTILSKWRLHGDDRNVLENIIPHLLEVEAYKFVHGRHEHSPFICALEARSSALYSVDDLYPYEFLLEAAHPGINRQQFTAKEALVKALKG